MPRPTLSVIIPCWNDAHRLRRTLDTFARLRGIHEVVVADASEADDCRQIGQSFGAKVIRVERPNRGRQMNAAAAMATGDVLLFHHVDTEFGQANVDAILSLAADPVVAGGAFYRRFDPTHRARLWLEPWVRRVNRRGTLYGDQSVFVRRDLFGRLGGFRDIPLMEDVEFSRRLRGAGKVVLLDPPILSSARRHKVHGRLRVSVENAALILLFKLGVSPAALHRWYYRKAKRVMAS